MDIIKAERATVKFFDGLEIDGYRMPDGEFRVSATGASILLGFSKEWLGRSISRGGSTFKTLQEMGFNGQTVSISVPDRVGGRIDTISMGDLSILTDYAVQQGKHEAMRLKGVVVISVVPLTRKKVEKEIQRMLLEKYGGATEVECPAGRIDVLTPSEIIEIKNIQNWKDAIGQILVYGRYYPSHQKRIHLFGEAHSHVISMINEHCHGMGIIVTYQ